MRTLVFTLLTVALSCNMLSAQNGYEITAKTFQNSFSKQMGHDAVSKVLANKQNKKSNGYNYNGEYTNKIIQKGNKIRTDISYNNSVMINTPNGDGKSKIVTYYPYIKKGWTMIVDTAKLPQISVGEIEKTGEIMEVLGYKCDIYRQKMQGKTETPEMTTEYNTHNDFAICSDTASHLPMSEIFPGIKGHMLKSTTNTVITTTSKTMNIDQIQSVSTIVESFNQRDVDDSEFEVPSDIVLYDVIESTKIMEENKNYMIKNGLWNELPPDNHKIYDNLTENWDF